MRQTGKLDSYYYLYLDNTVLLYLYIIYMYFYKIVDELMIPNNNDMNSPVKNHFESFALLNASTSR